ncbi:MAG: DUF2851 family protein [Bacteroidetes bacterium]|nr:DUF2851 family protein [Bacteroidota bacterium]
MKSSNIPEDFLHFLWRKTHFDLNQLETTTGEKLVLEKIGYGHADAGPDFQDARIRIGGTLWAGHVEIHILASDWYAHGHQNDPAYDNVILHVVLEEDKVVFNRMGNRIPCLILKDRLPKKPLKLYHAWMRSRQWIACESRISEVPVLDVKLWLDRLLVERLEHKVHRLSGWLEKYRGDWEKVFQLLLFYGYGLKVNAGPMEMLAHVLPLKLLRQYRSRLVELEALVLGMAGLIPDSPEDTYSKRLKNEFTFLQHKHQLSPLPRASWKYSRLRPAAFPEVRLVRLAGLYHQEPYLMRTMLEPLEPKAFTKLLVPPVSPYWQHHYRFGKYSEKGVGNPGGEWVRVMLLNVFIPFLFFYGRQTGQEKYQNRALSWLEEMPVENNKIIRNWKKHLDLKTAGEGQAAMHLHKVYCKKKKCLDCRVGQHLMIGGVAGSRLPQGNDASQQEGG